MNERVHACLDGTLDRDDLSAAERLELERLEAIADEAARLLRERPAPDLAGAVMRRIAALPPRTVRPAALPARLAAALWRPRDVTLRLRPAHALAAAALAALLLALSIDAPVGDGVGERPAAAAPELAAPPIYVQFRVQIGEASRVALAGSFTDWQPRIELVETEPGLWSTLVPLPAGVHDYAFIIDGEHWLADPYAPHVADGFGGVNSRLSLLLPSSTL